jgi:ankyrin repeat protein
MEHGADVNARDANGGTALHEAVRQGKIEWVKELVAHGADLNARTEAPARGRGPAGGGFRFRSRSGMTAFLAAAETGDVAMMQELIKLGADSKGKIPDGTTALVLAAGSKKVDAVKFLVDLGADVNEAPAGIGGPLHIATRFGSNDIVQYLVEHGANLDVKDRFGRNALEEAEFEAPKPTIELLRKLYAERKH